MGDFRSKLGNYRTVADLAKALHSANQTIGKKGTIIPTPQSSSEEVAAFRKAMGVPEQAGDYGKTVVPETLPEGVQWSDEMAAPYYEVAHRHNIPPAAMKELVALNLKQREFELQAQTNSVMETKRHAQAELRRDWGVDFDHNIGLAQRAAHLAGVNPNSYGWRDPEVVRGFVYLAGKLGEDSLVGAGGALPVGAHDMKSRALDIMRNPQNPEHQRYRDGDREVQGKVRRWLEQSETTLQRR
jgi:hypothetical protein